MIQKNNLLEQISNKRTSLEKKQQNLDYLVNSSFLEVHRLLVLLFQNEEGRKGDTEWNKKGKVRNKRLKKSLNIKTQYQNISQ